MKKFWFIFLSGILYLSIQTSNAQSKQTPFFNKNGTVALQTRELDALADTIAVINHRADDIVWSRIVYRVIDMRDKQNYQLYFPRTPNEQYKSLFRLILDAVADGKLKAYQKMDRDIIPLYSKEITPDSLKNMFTIVSNDTVNHNTDKQSLLQIDPVTNKMTVSSFLYPAYIKNQLKFLIQEIIFFDKHTSRMYSKIIGIAPIYSMTESNIILGKSNDAWSFFQSSVLCWFLFDELRPFLAKQYVIPNGNDSERLTYDDFFTQQLYSSYLAGDSNMNNRMILQYLSDPDKIHKEQQRIENELLNFEQDLWEY